MKRFGQFLFKGLATAAPLLLTLWLLYWAASGLEAFARPWLEKLLPAGTYFVGMGLIAALLLISGLGLLANLYLVRVLLSLLDRIMSRIPLVKTLFQGIKDFAQLLAGEKTQQMGRVVSIELQGVRLIGFVVRDPASLPGITDAATDLVSVYLPMSYQVGGYTVYVPKSRLTKLDMSVEDAMRTVITGGAGQKK
jgi:uncharacterized membrane protein